MSDAKAEKIKQEIFAAYGERTRKARELNAEAGRFLPGGDTRTATYFFPYPPYMEAGNGCRLRDVDGNEYLDFLNNYTSLIHGHAHPAVTAAAAAQLQKGTVLGSPAEIQLRHAAHLCARVPSIESVRYCNSGTEATLFAIRAARAHTRKDAIIKMDGGYHGSHDAVDVNVTPDTSGAGLPAAHAERGVPRSVLQDVLVVPFNDLAAAEQALRAHRERVAALIVEPILGAGGGIPPEPGYLQGLRVLTEKHGVLLIFDEIISFRLHAGGLQAQEGVIPDLTALGKIIGGGFPVGAFGGRRDIMERFAPFHPENLAHSGTFNGNNITMAAGLAALECYGQAECDRLNALGERLRRGFRRAMEAIGIQGQVLGQGSVVVVMWRPGRNTNARHTVESVAAAGALPALLHLELLNRGIYFAGRGMFALSTPMGEAEVDAAAAAFAGALETLRPVVAAELPHLLKG
jgi:glutamate-1-semialdehyde 2,1-aminomutase